MPKPTENYDDGENPPYTEPSIRKVEKKYGRQLRQIAGHIDSIIKGFDVTDETVYPSIVTALRKYR